MSGSLKNKGQGWMLVGCVSRMGLLPFNWESSLRYGSKPAKMYCLYSQSSLKKKQYNHSLRIVSVLIFLPLKSNTTTFHSLSKTSPAETNKPTSSQFSPARSNIFNAFCSELSALEKEARALTEWSPVRLGFAVGFRSRGSAAWFLL